MEIPKILYLDNHLMVVDKPAGMPVQADETGDLDVQSWGKSYLKNKFDKPGKVFLALVHRLDRPVSGVLVMARTSKAAERLSEQIRKRTVQKVYWALVSGNPPELATCEDYLLKSERKVMSTHAEHPQAQFASLHFKRLQKFAKSTLLEIDLETGRKHQIRVQLSLRDFPIIGDVRYGSTQILDGRNLALCCKKMGIKHPTTKEPLLWEAELPVSWKNWMG